MNPIKFIFWFGLAFFLLCMCSCVTSNKAKNYMRNNPGTAAELCAEMFPVKAVTDSTDFKESLAKIDSLINADSVTRSNYSASIDELFATIDRLTAKAPEDCDSLAEAVYQYAAKEKKRADEAEKSVKRLQAEVRNVKPIRDTIVDMALVKLTEHRLENAVRDNLALTEKLSKITLDRDEWRSKAKSRWWLLWIIIVICGVVIFRKSIFSLIKLPFMKVILFLFSLAMVSASCNFKGTKTSTLAEGLWIVPLLLVAGIGIGIYKRIEFKKKTGKHSKWYAWVIGVCVAVLLFFIIHTISNR